MNKHFRILIAVLLVAVMVLGVVGCTGDPVDETPDTTAAPQTNDSQPQDPGTTPEDPGTNPEDPGTNPDDPGTNPDDPGTNPDDPGTNPDNPGTNPDDPGTNPDDPGTNPGDPVGPVPGDGQWDEFAMTATAEGVKILGVRNATTINDNRIWLDWAGSGIELAVTLDVNYDVRINVQAMALEGTCTFAVYVDDVLFDSEGNGGYYTIACGLEEQFIDLKVVTAGDHVIKIVKIDGIEIAAEILSVQMDGSFRATPADKDLYIEFIGDSITTGKTDITKSYAWAVANGLNADYAMTAINGYGLIGDVAMGDIYGKLNPVRDNLTDYTFLREADVVVINLGAEDYFYYVELMGEDHEAEIQAAYEALLAEVRYWNPNAKILCVYGAANDGYAAQIEAAAADKAGVYTLALTVTAEEGDGESLVAPSAAEQAAYATAIQAKIADILDDVIEGDAPVTGEGDKMDWSEGAAV